MDIDCLKLGLHCLIYSSFTPYFMCWNYFDECCMNKSLLHTSLTKFNKINKRRKRTVLITKFKKKHNIKAWFLISKISFDMYIAFALYLTFIFQIFSVYLCRVVWSTYTCSRTIYLTRCQNNVLWIICAFIWLRVFLMWLHCYSLCLAE